MKTSITLLFALTISTVSAQSLPVVDPLFSNVPIACSTGFALQSSGTGTCTSKYPQQGFNAEPGIGWRFSQFLGYAPPSSGLTQANTAFNPPSFAAFPFIQAGFLQGRSEIAQLVPGFVVGVRYQLFFYLGSRYARGDFDGNQTVSVLLDNHEIARYSLISFTPFTQETTYFEAAFNGPHVVRFVGIAPGDHTAFFSGVSIEADTADAE